MPDPAHASGGSLRRMAALLSGAATFLLLTGLGPVETIVHKVPGGTMVAGTSTTVLDMPYQVFADLMCHYELAGEVSDDDVVNAEIPVHPEFAASLLARMPEDPEAVRIAALANTAPIDCPNGETKVVTILDFPWPIRTAWQVSNFAAGPISGGVEIHYDFVGGTALENSGSWTIRPTPEGLTWLAAGFRFDVGFRLPEFLIRWGVKRVFPDLFAAMERYGRAYARRRDTPTPRPTPPILKD